MIAVSIGLKFNAETKDWNPCYMSRWKLLIWLTIVVGVFGLALFAIVQLINIVVHDKKLGIYEPALAVLIDGEFLAQRHSLDPRTVSAIPYGPSKKKCNKSNIEEGNDFSCSLFTMTTIYTREVCGYNRHCIALSIERDILIVDGVFRSVVEIIDDPCGVISRYSNANNLQVFREAYMPCADNEFRFETVHLIVASQGERTSMITYHPIAPIPGSGQ